MMPYFSLYFNLQTQANIIPSNVQPPTIANSTGANAVADFGIRYITTNKPDKAIAKKPTNL